MLIEEFGTTDINLVLGLFESCCQIQCDPGMSVCASSLQDLKWAEPSRCQLVRYVYLHMLRVQPRLVSDLDLRCFCATCQ